VKHRSPLFTLAALALAFAIMFIVNMLAEPPGGTAGPAAAPPTVTAASPSPAPTQTTAASPVPTESESLEDDTFAERIVYAGRAEDGGGAIAIAVLGDQTAAYYCDGRSVESWFRGSVTGPEISLKSKAGVTLRASLDGDHLKGTVRVQDDRIRFEIDEAKKPAGLYRARGSKTTIGWIVLQDGSEVGVQTTGETSTPAPDLDPQNPRVTVDGENLDAAPVNGNESL
jgi:hypothetical protein